jgi:hypothetical protein
VALWRGVGPRKTECHPDRPHYAKGLCKQCYRSTPAHKAQRHGYYVRNRARYAQYTVELRERRVREAKLYGIDKATYDAMLAAQGGRCAICRRAPGVKSLNIDHNHATGAVRGLLCGACNRGMGMLGDNAARLRKAAAYLESRDGALRAASAATGTAYRAGQVPMGGGGVSSEIRQDGLRS